MKSKRLIVVVEGESEEQFVYNILSPYFMRLGFMGTVTPIKSKKTGGGLSKYSDVSKLLRRLISEKESVVTTMFDFYKLPKSFPGNKQIKSTTPSEKVYELEESLHQDIRSGLKNQCVNFIPYIQLHEFEALIFSDTKGLDCFFDERTAGYPDVRKFINSINNPELVNNGESTAPSKRLLMIQGYDKVVHGVLALEEIGMEQICQKCPHFREWISSIAKVLNVRE